MSILIITSCNQEPIDKNPDTWRYIIRRHNLLSIDICVRYSEVVILIPRGISRRQIRDCERASVRASHSPAKRIMSLTVDSLDLFRFLCICLADLCFARRIIGSSRWSGEYSYGNEWPVTPPRLLNVTYGCQDDCSSTRYNRRSMSSYNINTVARRIYESTGRGSNLAKLIENQKPSTETKHIGARVTFRQYVSISERYSANLASDQSRLARRVISIRLLSLNSRY